MKRISIVTPCFNAESYIAETVCSAIHQRAILSNSVELEYIICDGLSSDRTIDIAESLLQEASGSLTYKIISETDAGMYEALAKGLKLASGDIIAYINAGDFYHPSAFDIVVEIITPQLAEWVTGYTVCYNERSQLIGVTLPYRYRRHLFECGYYGNGLPHVQQESTFWAAHLNQCIDYEKLASFKYAGDFYLWLQFSKVVDLKVVKSHLGGFKYHGGHLSQKTVNNVNAYQLELQKIIRKPTLQEKVTAAVDRIVWSAPYKLKKRLSGHTFVKYDRNLKAWTLEVA
jgi:glycosyltransferase involved in cell wall biosynthesis